MMTYKFPQFNIEIKNPSILISLNTIQDRALDKLLSVFVILTTDTAEFGVMAENMPYVNSWEDDDIPAMVNIWLSQYAV